jgi:predicted RNase H-like nuclease (RuvC/YqgF family)
MSMRREGWVLLISLIVGFGRVDAVGAAKIFKWVDEKGVTHYGESIPPEYKDQASTEMSKHGLTVRKIDAATTGNDQKKAAEEKAARDREEKQRAFEQRRRDMALMNTYTSAREIDEHRERTLQVPMQTLKGLEPRLKKAQDRLASLQGQAAALAKKGKSTEMLEQDIADEKAEIDSLKADMDRGQAQIEAIKAKFDADKKRFLELSQR